MTNEKSSKLSKEYEKERRDRLNVAFDKLSSALPEYDPVNSLSKIDILTKAFDYIQKLETDRNKPSESIEKSCEKENLCLKAKVKHLSSRIRQLMDVMYSSKIEVPEKLPPTSTYTPLKHCKWNGKGGDKKVQHLLKSICDKNKENKKNKQKCKQAGKTKQPSQAKNQTRTSRLYRQKKRIIRLVGNEDKLGSLSSISNVVLSIADINAPATETLSKPACVSSNIVPLQENNSKNKIVSANQNTVEIKNNSMQSSKLVSLISAPIMATGITSTLPIQNIVQNVNLGTYILPNGQLMSVQQQAPIIPQITPQFLINRPVTPVIVMQNNNNINNRPSIIIKNSHLNCESVKNNCRPIYPKMKHDSTRTTFTNQKPIPSLNLNFSSSKCSRPTKSELANGRKRKLTKENLRSITQNKSMKNTIKKRNIRKGKKLNCKTDKENTHFKIKLTEKVNIKRSKLQKRVKTKNSKNILNKLTNYKATNGSLIKKSSSLNGCDFIRNKKANLGSINRLDEASNAKRVKSINEDTPSGDFSTHSPSNFMSVSESGNLVNSTKSSTAGGFSQKNDISSDNGFNKNLAEKSTCDMQMKVNSSIVESSIVSQVPNYTAPNTSASFNFDPKLVDTFNFSSSKDVLNQLGTYEKNSFLPILPPYLEDVREFPSDILSSLQIPSNLHSSESLSPTAAFLLSFPLVSTSKNSELLNENELSCENQNDTSTSILQIGNIESPSSSIIEGQTVLFDQQYAQISKSHYFSKSCDKIESNQKYNDSLSLNFEHPNVESIHAPGLLDKKCSDFSDSSSKATHLKDKTSSSNNSNLTSCKDALTSMDRVSFEQKSNITTTSSSSNTFKQNTTNFNSASHIATACSTKETSKTASAVCNNLLPVFSEVYCAKNVERSTVSEPASKSNERYSENSKKLKDKTKSKTAVNPEAAELNFYDKMNATKNDGKNCKDKSSSALTDNNSNSTKSLVNWMTAPDVRSHVVDQFTNLELFASQNLDFLATSSVPANSYSVSFASPSIDQLFEYSSAIDNNKLYNPNYPAILNQPNVWSPSKSSLSHHSVGPHLDSNNFTIPSTLPTLIGDLALGTNTTPAVDAFKMGAFEMIPDNYVSQKIGEPLMNETQKSNDRAMQDQKTEAGMNEPLPGVKCKMKENAQELPCSNKKQVSDTSKSQQQKLFPCKKPEFNDKSQQTSATNFLSVSQLVDQNQVKSSEMSDENQFTLHAKRSNVTRQKQVNKSACNFFNSSCNSEKQVGSKSRHTKKGANSTSNNNDEHTDRSSNQRAFNQTPAGNRIISDNSWYQNQSQKEPSSLETSLKSNNYSAESLLSNDHCHSQVMNYNPLSEIHSSQNCPSDKSGKLQSSSVNNYFIPTSQPHHGNFQQVNNLIPPSNTFGEPLQFSNQTYQTDSYDKNNTGYYSFVPSSQMCHVATKNTSSAKPEPSMNFYPPVTNASSTSLKNSKEKRTSCKHATDMKNQPSNVELNHGINSYITPSFSRPLLTSTLSTSNYLFTDPVYTNTQSSLPTNKIDNSSAHYSNENFLRPCVSISDYAPFDDCNFKTPQNPLSITNTLVPPSTTNNSLYLPHTSLPCNALATNFKNKTANFSNFLTPVVSTNSLSICNSNLPNYTPAVITSCNTPAATSANTSNYLPSAIPSSIAPPNSSSAISTYLPTFIATTTSLTSTTANFSNYLPPVILTSKGNKKPSSCSVSKSTASSSIANYLPPIISTTCITGTSNKISYLPPVISTSSLVFSQNNTISNYLPSIISTTSSSISCESSVTNYLPPVISTSNTIGNGDVSTYLPPVLPTLNDASLYLPLNNTNSSSTGSSISTQYMHPSSSNYASTTTNAKVHFSSSTYLPYSTSSSTSRSSSSSQSKYVPSCSHNNPSYQPYTSNASTSNSGNSSNYLPIFSSKANHTVASSYMPVFSSSTSGASSSSSYLPIFSSSSTDLTIISSNYLPLPNCNQVHNSFPSLNTSYTSNYLPPAGMSSGTYFPVTLNSTVSSSSQSLISTSNYSSKAAPYITNSVSSSASVQASSSYSASSSVSPRSSSKAGKSSPGSCKNYNVTVKPRSTGSEMSSTEMKKLQTLNNKPSQDETNPKSNSKPSVSVAGTQLKSCNPCGVSKVSSSSNSRAAKANHEMSSSNPNKPSAVFEMPKALPNQQIIAGNFEIEQSNLSFSNNLKASEKPSSMATMFPINSSTSAVNNFNCVYSTSDTISCQPINLPNSFQNRPEYMDSANICPLFSNDIGTYAVKNTPSVQKYVPSNEQVAYNTTSNPGSSSLTNFNLCAILPEMNEKLRCHNSVNVPFSAQGAPEQASFGKFDFYQYPEKKGPHQPLTDKKEQQMQHVGQNTPVNQSHVNNAKPASSLYQSNLETS